jgi:hypothetical protein
VRFAEVGAAPFLRYLLALQRRDVIQGIGDDAFTGPGGLYRLLQFLYREQVVAIDDRRADVADDVVRAGDRRVRQQGHDVLEAAAGDEDERDVVAG